jgi:hypothetical protein
MFVAGRRMLKHPGLAGNIMGKAAGGESDAAPRSDLGHHPLHQHLGADDARPVSMSRSCAGAFVKIRTPSSSADLSRRATSAFPFTRCMPRPMAVKIRNHIAVDEGEPGSRSKKEIMRGPCSRNIATRASS